MPTESILSFTAAYFSVIVAIAVLSREWKSLVHRAFAAGMLVLASEQLFQGLGYRAILPADVMQWQKRQLAVSALIPSTWLLFSTSYARVNYGVLLQRWKWCVLALFAVPVAIVTVFRHELFTGTVALEGAARWGLSLGTAGSTLVIVQLLSSVAILMHLERTLRASKGRVRWQIKFMLLGLAAIFGVRIYTSSQTMLLSRIDTGFGILQSVALLVANIFFIQSLLRTWHTRVDVYLSGATIRQSLTVLLVGIYLITVGFLAHFAQYFSPAGALPVTASIVFAGLTTLAVLLFSDRLRQKVRRFVSLHFNRPRYDYRQVWLDLTSRTSSVVNADDLCRTVAYTVSELLEIHSVNVWLVDEGYLTLAGSTQFGRQDARELSRIETGTQTLISALTAAPGVIDFRDTHSEWPEDIMRRKANHFDRSKLRWTCPLKASGQLVGMISLNDDQVGQEALSVEDFEVLETLAAQLAASLLNLRLSAQLRQTKEVEAFQAVSTFFVHDLKNLASKLSLTMKNLPIHFANPDFRNDALKTISGSVTRINEMCNRLSTFRDNLELRMTRTDLNDLVRTCIDELRPACSASIHQDLTPIPNLNLDPAAIHKVVTNLLINANEALEGEGSITIRTMNVGDAVVLSVKDNGCGIPQEFLERSLFRPFQTTKKRGLGIGLFQSKLIVEAHKGRIEVRSNVRVGTEFRIVLPAA